MALFKAKELHIRTMKNSGCLNRFSGIQILIYFIFLVIIFAGHKRVQNKAFKLTI